MCVVCSSHLSFVITASLVICCCLVRWPWYLSSLVVQRYVDSGYHCFVVAIRVDLSRRFCVSAVSGQGSACEYVVKLLALFGWVVRGFVVVLLVVGRVGQHQLALDCPVPEPLASGVLLSKCVSSDVSGVDRLWFVV